MTWTVHCADVLIWCEDYATKIERGEELPFHGILTDPSYGLGDNPDIEALLTAWMSGEDYDTGPGFMQRDWDVLPSPRYWRALRRVCHPGAYLFAFGGTRTADLLSVTIRLGGWERFDEIDSLSWCYGQGFPKNHAIGKAIDRGVKAEREVIGKRTDVNRGGGVGTFDDDAYVWQPEMNVTAPATPLAATWEGYGTALKPAHEPILCFRNPKQGTYAQNCVSTGAGGLWIEGGRVEFGNSKEEQRTKDQYARQQKSGARYFNQEGNAVTFEYTQDAPQGRWPPNVCLSHVPPRPDGTGGWLPGCERRGVKRVRHEGGQPQTNENRGMFGIGHGISHADPDGLEAVTAYACVLACDACGHQWTAEQRGACPECGGESRWACAAAELAEQSGELKTRPAKAALSGEGSGDGHSPNNGWGMKSVAISGYADQGTAARFYPQFTWQHEIAERLAGVVPFRYVAKAGRAQRDAGLETLHDKSTVWGNGLNSATKIRTEEQSKSGVDRGKCRNPHPTVKNIELTKWLATLLLPPPEYAPRRILIPFGGVMSEAIGAVLAGWDEVVAIEMEEEYCTIGESRLRFWADWAARGYDEPAAILKAAKQEEERREEAQMELL